MNYDIFILVKTTKNNLIVKLDYDIESDTGVYYLLLLIDINYYLELQKISYGEKTNKYKIEDINFDRVKNIIPVYTNDLIKVSKNYAYDKKYKYKQLLLLYPFHSDIDISIINKIKYILMNYFDNMIKLYIFMSYENKNFYTNIINLSDCNFTSFKNIIYSNITNNRYNNVFSMSTYLYKGSCDILSKKSNMNYILYTLKTIKFISENSNYLDKNIIKYNHFDNIKSINDKNINSHIHFIDLDKIYSLRTFECSYFEHNNKIILKSEHTGHFTIKKFDLDLDDKNVHYYLKLGSKFISENSGMKSSDYIFRNNTFSYHTHPSFIEKLKNSNTIAQVKSFPSFPDLSINLLINFIFKYIKNTSYPKQFIITEEYLYMYGFDFRNNKSITHNNLYIIKSFISHINSKEDNFMFRFSDKMNEFYLMKNNKTLEEYIEFFNNCARYIFSIMKTSDNINYVEKYNESFNNMISPDRDPKIIKKYLYDLFSKINFIDIDFISWEDLYKGKHFICNFPRYLNIEFI